MGLEEHIGNATGPAKYAIGAAAAVIALPFTFVGYAAYCLIDPADRHAFLGHTLLGVTMSVLGVTTSVMSLLPREGQVKLLEAEDAVSNTKRTGLLEAGVGAADIAYGLVTGDTFLPGYGLLSGYLFVDGLWRFQRASAGWQQFYERLGGLCKEFSYVGGIIHGREPKPRGTFVLEVPFAVVKRMFD